MTPLQFTRNVRALNRIRRIAQVLTQHGFGHIVSQMNLGRFVPVWMARKRKVRPEVEEGASAVGRRLRLVCSDLGPTFIKFAQMLTTRPDLLPRETAEELQALQDHVPPFDADEAMRVIEQELGRPASDCFASIEREPVASGSIAQVHRARLHTGQDVMVKVRRPGISAVVQLDIQLLRWLAETLERLVPELAAYRPAMLVSEFEEVLLRELDFVHEAAVTARFSRAFEGHKCVRTPYVCWDFSSSRVLTLEALGGVNIDEWMGRPTSGEMDKKRVARELVEAYLYQVFELGLFHGDPHPGNILIDERGRIGLVDFGQVGTISDELMTQLVVAVYAGVNLEMDILVGALADMGALGPRTKRRELKRSLWPLINKYHGLPLKRIEIGTVLGEFMTMVRQHDVVMPREVAMLAKALGMALATGRRLDPDLDLLELIEPRLRQAIRSRLSPARLSRVAAITGWQLLGLVRHVPQQLGELLQRLSSGTWELNVKHERMDRLINELDRSSNRIAFSVVIAAIIVGSSIVIGADSELTFFDVSVQYLGLVGFVLAGVLGLGLAWAVFRSGRLH